MQRIHIHRSYSLVVLPVPYHPLAIPFTAPDPRSIMSAFRVFPVTSCLTVIPDTAWRHDATNPVTWMVFVDSDRFTPHGFMTVAAWDFSQV